MNILGEERLLRQESIELNLNTDNNIKELNHAQSLINLISRIRNKIIYSYHQLIYDTGACLFNNPNIVLCLRSILYKISSEFEGSLSKANLTYMEDIPYLKIPDETIINDSSLTLLNELFNFLIDVRSYKTIIAQIDKETAELLYLIFEKKETISKENINKINKGIVMFKNLKRLRQDILSTYKNEIYDFITRNNSFCYKIDLIGNEAFEKKITDIYEIVMLKKKFITEEEKSQISMAKNIDEGKNKIKKILEKERNDEILLKNDSMIEKGIINEYE